MSLKKTCQLLALLACLWATIKGYVQDDPEHFTATIGEDVILPCAFEFPENKPVPYVIQWQKQGINIPIYIWYDGYPPHAGDGYEGRVSLAHQASLNLTNVHESDQGWYECKVYFLNRPQDSPTNGTWVHLDVNAPPHFKIKPPDVVYVKVGESVSLPCEAEGTPPTNLIWYKDNSTLEENRTVQILPTELKINNLTQTDIGDYMCMARNREGTVTSTSKVIVAGPASIVVPPRNVTKLESDKAEFICEAKALPPNVTHRWFHNGVEITQLSWLENRTVVRRDGTLFISPTSADDSGKFTCEVTNGIGTPDTASAYLSVECPASIVVPPRNVTKLEGHKAEFICEAKALPTNVTHRWFHNGVEISQLSWLEKRTVVRRDGTLFISPTSADDSGKFTCKVTNGIGTPDTASAYLSVEYPARITYSPTIQYLPLGLSGVVRCYVQANPPTQLITWTRDRRPFDPNSTPGVVTLNNGSLLFQRVSHEHQGRYRCTPYNIHATGGTSNVMEVLVREPPMYTLKPKEIYQKPVHSEIKLPCDGIGQPKPAITWRRVDGSKLPRERVLIRGGNLTIRGLKKEDHGRYECVLENEIATLVTRTLLLVERTTPYAPTNVTVNTSGVAATLTWLPAYDGGHEQTYVIWYRLADQSDSDWRRIGVYPDRATTFTVYNLQADTEYDFQVLSRNKLGDGMFSPIIRAKTKSADYISSTTTTESPCGTGSGPSTSTSIGEKSPGNTDSGYVQNDPEHFTATIGEHVILRCAFEFPENKPVPYVLQWQKQGINIPIYIWYDGYPPHAGDGYEGRVSHAYQASLNLTNVHESDKGWYECKVFIYNRPPDSPKNGTWVHLDVLG